MDVHSDNEKKLMAALKNTPGAPKRITRGVYGMVLREYYVLLIRELIALYFETYNKDYLTTLHLILQMFDVRPDKHRLRRRVTYDSIELENIILQTIYEDITPAEFARRIVVELPKHKEDKRVEHSKNYYKQQKKSY